MKKAILLPESYEERMKEILDISWKIFKSKFIDGRHEILKEAPFQHHFSTIISTIGQSYCSKRTDILLVDLEKKWR